MITVVIRRSDNIDDSQLTQKDVIKQIWGIPKSEILLEDTWGEGLKKVRTPYVSLIEADCVLSAHYYSSNAGLMAKAHQRIDTDTALKKGSGWSGGGYQKLAMLSSCVGIRDFGNRIYNYELQKAQDINVNDVTGKSWHISPNRKKLNMKLYHIQVGFVPGAIIRMSAIKDIIEDELWDNADLVKLSTALSFYIWDTGRRVQLNPNTTYVSADLNLESPPLFETKVPDKVANIFNQEGIGLFGV